MARTTAAEHRRRVEMIMRTVGIKMSPDARRDLQAVLELFLRGKSGDGGGWFVLTEPAVSIRFSVTIGRRLLEYTRNGVAHGPKPPPTVEGLLAPFTPAEHLPGVIEALCLGKFNSLPKAEAEPDTSMQCAAPQHPNPPPLAHVIAESCAVHTCAGSRTGRCPSQPRSPIPLRSPSRRESRRARPPMWAPSRSSPPSRNSPPSRSSPPCRSSPPSRSSPRCRSSPPRRRRRRRARRRSSTWSHLARSLWWRLNPSR